MLREIPRHLGVGHVPGSTHTAASGLAVSDLPTQSRLRELETVRGFLREDDGREARQLLSKLIEEKGVDDMLITLADCLKEHIQSGINEKVVREQLSMYSDS